MRKESFFPKQDWKLENKGTHVAFLRLMLKSHNKEKTHFSGSNHYAATQYFPAFWLKLRLSVVWVLPKWYSSKESTCQCRKHKRCRFDPWVKKVLWSRNWQPAPVFLPEKFHGQGSLVGYSPESDTTEHACNKDFQGHSQKMRTYSETPEPGCRRRSETVTVPWAYTVNL